MENDFQDINQVIAATGDAVIQLTDLMAAVDTVKVNHVPFEGSWTAPQLLRHVSKSIAGMAIALPNPGKSADRDNAQRVQELRSIFLDTPNKFESPDFIVPEDGTYEKQASIDELNKAFSEYAKAAIHANPGEMVEGLPFGPVTKWELMHFTLFHTQRHLNQMRRICEAL